MYRQTFSLLFPQVLFLVNYIQFILDKLQQYHEFNISKTVHNAFLDVLDASQWKLGISILLILPVFNPIRCSYCSASTFHFKEARAKYAQLQLQCKNNT